MRLVFPLSLSTLLFACTPTAAHCVTGMAIQCACSGTTQGVQTCLADGTFSTCACNGTDGGTPTADAGSDAGSDAAVSTTDGGTDAFVSTDGGTDAALDALYVGHVFYAGMVNGVGPVWSAAPGAAGQIGLAAGNSACTAIGVGADHACDYEELRAADANNEAAFRAIAAGTTGWVQRTTHALVGGVDSAPGPGGNCDDWNYATNHIGDGEYVTFDTAGHPTYHLDNDTIFDPAAGGIHTIPGDLQCGGVTRAILCCFPLPH